MLDADGVYRKTGPARVFVRETDAVAAIKGQGDRPDPAGRRAGADGPRSAGLGHGGDLPDHLGAALSLLGPRGGRGHRRPVLRREHRGVHRLVAPEALAGGPLGKVRDGDRIRIVIDRHQLEGSVDLVGDGQREFSPEEAARVLCERPPHPELSPDPCLPPETRLWAALQRLGGGTWGGCVYDVEEIVKRLEER